MRSAERLGLPEQINGLFKISKRVINAGTSSAETAVALESRIETMEGYRDRFERLTKATLGEGYDMPEKPLIEQLIDLRADVNRIMESIGH